MNCLLLLLCAAAAGSSLGEVQVVERSTMGLTVEIRAPEPVLSEDGVRAPGWELTAEEGEPRVPFVSFLIGVPPEGKVRVSVDATSVRTIPCGPLRPFFEEPKGMGHEEVSAREGPYPKNWAEVEVLGFLRSQRVAKVTVFPYRYEPGIGIRYAQRLTVGVTFRNPAGKRIYAPSHEEPSSVERMLSRMLLNYEEAKALRRTPPTAKQAALKLQPCCKILVNEDGMYRITPEDIRRAGWTPETIDPRYLHLRCRGREVPIKVVGGEDGRFDRGDWIEFWGEYNRRESRECPDLYQDPYGRENVYWLSVEEEPGLRMAEESGAMRHEKCRWSLSYDFTEHFEKDRTFDRLGRMPEDGGDYWFWDEGIFGGHMREYTCILRNPDTGSLRRPTVEVMLRGKTYPEGSPDHHVLLYFNDVLLGEAVWDGQALFRFVSDPESSYLMAAHLRDGENVLRVVLPGDERSAGPADAIYLDWFEVTYPRLFKAHEDYIEFSPSGGPGVYRFSVDGFSSPDIEVYHKGVARISGTVVEQVVQPEGGVSYRVRFEGVWEHSRPEYVALTRDRFLSPAGMELDTLGILYGIKGADYVAIAPRRFIDGLRPLLDVRRAQGLRVVAVAVEDIYDDFGYGFHTPEAIRAFLEYAYKYWSPPPIFVLLAGDASWDYRNIYGRGGNLVPTFLVRTVKFGATASDYPYSLVSGDDMVPDLWVGRIPARTLEELRRTVGKIVEYETSPKPGPWRARALLIGGMASVFRDQSEDLLEFLPDTWRASRLYLTPSGKGDPFFGGTGRLVDILDEGVSLVQFIGHGGGAIWSDAHLFRTGDVKLLRNRGKLPFVLSYTCFTGAFDSPFSSCLGEAFLRAENGGAVAWLGATGLGWVWHDYYLARSVLRTLFGGAGTLGEAVAEGKVDLMARRSGDLVRDMVFLYHLLGDPATTWSPPDASVRLEPPGPVRPGDELEVRGEVEGASDGAIWAALIDSVDEVWAQGCFRMEGGRFSGFLKVPEGMPSGRARLWAYASGGREGLGWVPVAIGTDYIVVDVRPERPASGDTVEILARICLREGRPGKVFCLFPDLGNSIEMEEVDGVYRALWKAGPPGEVKFYIAAEGGPRSEERSFLVGRGPELKPVSIYVSGDSVEVLVENRGDLPSEEVRAELFLDTLRAPLGESVVPPLAPMRDAPYGRASTRLSFPLKGGYPLGSRRVFLRLGGRWFPLSLSLMDIVLTPEDGTGGWASLGEFAFRVAGGTIQRPTAIRVQVEETRRNPDQPDLDPVLGVAYRLVSRDTLEAGQMVEVGFAVPEVGSDASVFRWEEDWGVWAHLPTYASGDTLRAHSDRLGTFSVLRSLAPEVEVYVPGGSNFASPRTEVSVRVRDRNGVHPYFPLEASLDGKKVARISVPDRPEDPRDVMFVVCLELSPGEHVLALKARDCSGNIAQKEVQLTVHGSFDVRGVGNYPNPFTTYTIFTYTLTAPAEEVSLRVYTASGRLIWRFPQPDDPLPLDDFARPTTDPGYHEVLWDGRDLRGEDVANGLYFCVLKAKSLKGKKVRRVLKVARSR